MGEVRRLIGVYNAEGSVRGEFTYLVKSTLGTAHCALCDITHGRLRAKREWNVARAGFPVPFDTYHLDELPVAVAVAVGSNAPVVIAETDAGYTVLLGADALDACDGSVDTLTAAVRTALTDANLTLP